MTDAAAFRATIHGIKTLPSRKVVSVTVEAPIEQLAHIARVCEHGAWVAVARLESEVMPAAGQRSVPIEPETTPRRETAGAKSQGQIAGYLCTLGSFHEFLRKKFTAQWNGNWSATETDEETAKQCVYEICTVTSRKDLTKDNAEWLALQLAYKLWMNEAGVVPA